MLKRRNEIMVRSNYLTGAQLERSNNSNELGC